MCCWGNIEHCSIFLSYITTGFICCWWNIEYCSIFLPFPATSPGYCLTKRKKNALKFFSRNFVVSLLQKIPAFMASNEASLCSRPESFWLYNLLSREERLIQWQLFGFCQISIEFHCFACVSGMQTKKVIQSPFYTWWSTQISMEKF